MGHTAAPCQTVNFEDEAREILDELHAALAQVLSSLQPPVRRAVELRRRLGLSHKVSWSIFNAATAGDPRDMVGLLPGRRAMESFVSAISHDGAAAAACERVQLAFDRFEESVTQHAGTRETYEAMVSGLGSARPMAAADLKHKRAAFRASSVLWGRYMRGSLLTMILHPGKTPGLLDQVFLSGTIGLQRTRPGARLRLVVTQLDWPGPGDPAESGRPHPLDPSGSDGIGLLREFCESPLPEFRLLESTNGTRSCRSYELTGERLGASGEVSFFTGEVGRDVSAAPGVVPGAEATLFTGIAAPTVEYNGDILIHRSVCGTRTPEVAVYSFATPPNDQTEFRGEDLLPVTEQGRYLGDGIDAARTPLFPRYVELLEYAMARMGWKPSEFCVFRCHIDYPMLYTRVKMTVR